MNTSGITPFRYLVVVRLKEATKKKGLIELPPGMVEQDQLRETRGEVIESGELAFTNNGVAYTEVSPGDLVSTRQYAGSKFEGDDGIIYTLMNDTDIFGKVEKL